MLNAATYALTAPPRSIIGALTGRRGVRPVAYAVLAICVGLLAWFLVFLTLVGAFRGIFHPLIDQDSYENSWGGPTLAGAWAVHFLVAAACVPLFIGIVAAIGAFLHRLERRVIDRIGPIWPVPVAILLTIGGVLFFVSWLHQAQ